MGKIIDGIRDLLGGGNNNKSTITNSNDSDNHNETNVNLKIDIPTHLHLHEEQKTNAPAYLPVCEEQKKFNSYSYTKDVEDMHLSDENYYTDFATQVELVKNRKSEFKIKD